MGAAILATNPFRLANMSGLQNEGHIRAAAVFLCFFAGIVVS